MAGKFFVHEGIKGELKAQIERGEYPEGARVPSEYELARRFGVSRNQTRQALRELELEGYVIRRRGSGSYVAPVEKRLAGSVFEGGMTVALVFPQYLSNYSRDVVDGFMQHIAMAGRQTIVYNVQFDEEREPRSLKAIAESGVAGLAVWVEHNNLANAELMVEFRERKFPVVLVDRSLPCVDLDSVTSDNVEIGYRLTKALIERGHRRIAFAGTARSNTMSVVDRLNGYTRALDEAGIAVDAGLVAQLSRIHTEPSVVAGELMGLYDRPSAIFCVHDAPARLLYAELVKFGYRIPEHVEIAALEDHHVPPCDPIPMISVSQRGFEIGAASAGRLLARLSNPDCAAVQCLIAPTGVVSNCDSAEASVAPQERSEWPVVRAQHIHGPRP